MEVSGWVPGLWSLVLGSFGPDLGLDLDLTWDLDLSLTIFNFENESVYSTPPLEGVLSKILDNNGGGLKSSGPGSSSSGCSSGEKVSDGLKIDGEGVDNIGLELGESQTSFQKTEI